MARTYKEIPGIDKGLHSRQERPEDPEWIQQRDAASNMDYNVRIHREQRLLGQLGAASWSEGPTVGLPVIGRDNTHPLGGEAPISPQRAPHFFRGMSEHEFQEAKSRGYIQSDMRGVISTVEGTNAATSPQTAKNYLPRSESGRIVKIENHPDDQWFESGVDNYARTRQQVPFDRVMAHTEEIPGVDTQHSYRADVVAQQKAEKDAR